MFALLLGTTLYVSFSSNTEVKEIIIRSITPVYDENSTIEVDNENVIFNDKNQIVDYKVVIENTQDYDVKITDITLSTPTEEFLQYTVEDISLDEVLKANETKEFTISLETIGIKGWGRNFADELTANISFEKQVKQDGVTPPAEDDKTEEKPEEDKTPNEDNQDNTTSDDTNDNGEGNVEPPNTSDNVLLVVLILATAVTGLVIILVMKNKFTKYTIFILALYSVSSLVNAEEVIELRIPLNVSFKSQNVMSEAYEYGEICSDWDGDGVNDYCRNGNKYLYFWAYAGRIKEIHINNDITEIAEFEYQFDVSEEQNGRVMAYLVSDGGEECDYDYETDEEVCVKTYILYLQADGIIYPNENASYYFANMTFLESVINLEGFDTSEVTDMSRMFSSSATRSKSLILDLRSFNTSKVVDMNHMFSYLGFDDMYGNCANSIIDVSGFNTGNVTDMSYMFSGVCSNNENFTLDLSKFDTSNVTNMSYMFSYLNPSNENFTLDLSNFDTSNVTNMSYMFDYLNPSNENFALDLSNFDTSNVKNMSYMFRGLSYNNENFILNLSNFDTSNVTNMVGMFSDLASYSNNITLDLTSFDTSKITDMSNMFSGIGPSGRIGEKWNGSIVIDVSSFDTSNVTNMERMFSGVGMHTSNVTLNLSSFDTSNVTNMESMFAGVSEYGDSLILDVSSFDTSNVTNMALMFDWTCATCSNLTLDVSNFDTSKVTKMQRMFYYTGRYYTGASSVNLKTSITIRNPSVSSYSMMFEGTGGEITVNYTSETEGIVDSMIATNRHSSVVKGELVD